VPWGRAYGVEMTVITPLRLAPRRRRAPRRRTSPRRGTHRRSVRRPPIRSRPGQGMPEIQAQCSSAAECRAGARPPPTVSPRARWGDAGARPNCLRARGASQSAGCPLAPHAFAGPGAPQTAPPQRSWTGRASAGRRARCRRYLVRGPACEPGAGSPQGRVRNWQQQRPAPATLHSSSSTSSSRCSHRVGPGRPHPFAPPPPHPTPTHPPARRDAVQARAPPLQQRQWRQLRRTLPPLCGRQRPRGAGACLCGGRPRPPALPAASTARRRPRAGPRAFRGCSHLQGVSRPAGGPPRCFKLAGGPPRPARPEAHSARLPPTPAASSCRLHARAPAPTPRPPPPLPPSRWSTSQSWRRLRCAATAASTSW
jgi:hypothetical protein